MVNFEDVKDTLKSTDLKTIYEDYTNRQQKNIEVNNKKEGLRFRGSTNQRIINVKESLSKNKVVIINFDDVKR